MKKLFFTLFTILNMLCLDLSVCAAETTYFIDEVKMNIEGPEGWSVLTRDIKDNDPTLIDIGLTKKEAIEYEEKNNIYLMALNEKGDLISVSITSYPGSQKVFNLGSLSDEQIEKNISKSKKGSLVYSIFTVDSDWSVYNQGKEKFLKGSAYYEEDGNKFNVYIYSTVVNGKEMVIILNASNGKPDNRLLEVQKKMVDSINFTEIIHNPNSIEKTDDGTIIKIILIIIFIIVSSMGYTLLRKNMRKNNARIFEQTKKRYKGTYNVNDSEIMICGYLTRMLLSAFYFSNIFTNILAFFIFLGCNDLGKNTNTFIMIFFVSICIWMILSYGIVILISPIKYKKVFYNDETLIIKNIFVHKIIKVSDIKTLKIRKISRSLVIETSYDKLYLSIVDAIGCIDFMIFLKYQYPELIKEMPDKDKKRYNKCVIKNLKMTGIAKDLENAEQALINADESEIMRLNKIKRKHAF